MAKSLTKVKKSLSEKEQTSLLLAIAIIFGSWLRLSPAWMAGFPINDGGMFYTMISDLGQHRYALPAFTTYNGGNIPFAYPPLALYAARILTDTLPVSILQILQWMPALISTLAIPAFFLLASELLKTRRQAALATIFFAFSPRAISWFIMGGGLTRVAGQIFMLLTLFAASRLFKDASRKNLGLTILFGVLTILSHPEAALQTAGAAILLWLATARNKTALINGIKVSGVILALTSIWWGTIILQHGLAPLLNAGQTGYPGLFLALIPFNFADESMLTVLSVLGIIGLFAKLGRREFFLPLWLAAAFFIDGRSAAWVANFSLALLAAVATDEIIVPGLASRQLENFPADSSLKTRRLAALYLVGYILVYLLMSTYLTNLTLTNLHLGENDRAAMAWIKENTATDSKFVLITPGTDYPMRDPVQEWFPALTERTSLTTLQGQEWILGPNFAKAMNDFRNLQACVTQNIDCVVGQTSIPSKTIDYIYISKTVNNQDCNSTGGCQQAQKFIQSARGAGRFKLVYENNDVAILQAEIKLQ